MDHRPDTKVPGALCSTPGFTAQAPGRWRAPHTLNSATKLGGENSEIAEGGSLTGRGALSSVASARSADAVHWDLLACNLEQEGQEQGGIGGPGFRRK